MNDNVLKVIEDLEDTGLETMIEAAETLRYEWDADYEPVAMGFEFGMALTCDNSLIISDNKKRRTVTIPEKYIPSLLQVVVQSMDMIKTEKEQ